ncbi:MAG: DUF2520 domain-containing protein [Pyrinomonadaceae bacterium]|nr:DUF2520 domain-containing protein [Pyrinomonadaceae bacterium]
MKVSIIGAGRLGGALAIALSKKGFEIENLAARKLPKAERIAEFIEPRPKIIRSNEFSEIASDVIFITTQDSEIAAVAQKLKADLSHQPIVFHTSGALSSDVLKDLKLNGCRVASFHPLISVSDAGRGAEKFANAYFCVEGDAEAVAVGEEIARELGGNSFAIETKFKTLYHASAVTACGHLVALVDAAIEMLTKCGLPEREAQKVLLPLIKSTVENLETQTTAESLTGTFARADVSTLEKHLETLRENVPAEILEIYLLLGLRSIPLAEKQGADKMKLAEISDKLLLAKKNLKC